MKDDAVKVLHSICWAGKTSKVQVQRVRARSSWKWRHASEYVACPIRVNSPEHAVMTQLAQPFWDDITTVSFYCNCRLHHETHSIQTLFHNLKKCETCMEWEVMHFMWVVNVKGIGWNIVFVQSLSCISALGDPMDYSMPGFPVIHYLQEFARIHAHWISDAV